MPRKHKAIYRTNKLKGRANISGIVREHSRTINCANADSSLKHLNDVLYGSTNHQADVDKLLNKVTAKTRKDAVLAFDFVLSASPEFFEENPVGSRKYEQWIQQSMKFLESQYGKNRIAYAVVHLDEKTPHIQGVIVPLDKKPDGSIGLNAKKFLDNGGRGNINGKLNKTQDAIGKYYAPLGIERGLKGSKATHKKIRTFYNELNELFPDIVKLTIEDVQQTVIGKFGNRNEEAQKVFDQLLAAAKTSKMRQLTAENFEEEVERLRAENAELAKQVKADVKVDNRKEIDKALRGLDLEIVASDLGLVKSQKDGYWRDPEEIFKIDIKGSKFFDFKADKGNSGAFDFVQHVNGVSFKDGRDYLASQYGFDEFQFDFATKDNRKNIDVHASKIEELKSKIDNHQQEINKEVLRINAIKNGIKANDIEQVKRYSRSNKSQIDDIKKNALQRFVPPPAVDSSWGKVRNYLVNIRKISSDFIDRLKSDGVLYSDKRNNAVWKYDEGAILHGTASRQGAKKFKGFAPGSSRKHEWCWSSSDNAKTAIICESPVDGISLVQLAGLNDVEIISTGGVSNEAPKRIQTKAFDNIIIAYDSDPAGQKAAYAMERKIRDVQKKASISYSPPSGVKDWNEVLQAKPGIEVIKQQLTKSSVLDNLSGKLDPSHHRSQSRRGGFSR